MPEGQPQNAMTIRVFYLSAMPHPADPNSTYLDNVSEEFKVSYLWKLDPIYHELCFTDDKGVRHQFVGLPYHVQEQMPDAGGIDGSA